MTVKEILLKLIRVVSLIKQISLNCPLFMLISLLKLLSGRYLLLGGCLAMSIRTLKQTFKQKNKNYIYIMLLCKYGEVYSGLRFCPCSRRSPAPVVPICPTATPPLNTLFTTFQMFPITPNHCSSPSPSLGVEGQFWHVRVLMFGIFLLEDN